MTLAIFDLDHTLINGDSDHLWGEYMVAKGIVDERAYRKRNDAFYLDYQRGTLDNDQYLAFALEPLTHYSLDELYAWRQDYVDKWIRPLVAPGTAALLDSHRMRDHELMIISATNLFVSEPIGQMLGVSTVLATEPEIIDNRYTGRFLGTPTYQQGKVTALTEWLGERADELTDSYFYSDSLNDLALLERVNHPVAVGPDDDLKAIAQERNWKIIDLG
jgi:HAD superfamily hydrolase (TIGR01490 family)